MDTHKITFLCFIFLFVIVLSNYMSVEGFKTDPAANWFKKIGKDIKKVAKKAEKGTVDAVKKIEKDTVSAAKKVEKVAVSTAKKVEKSGEAVANPIAKTSPDTKELNKMMGDIKSIKNEIQKSVTSAKNSESAVKGVESNINSKMDSKSKDVEKTANKAISNITGYSATVKQNMEASQNANKDMDAKISVVGKQVDRVKKYVDDAEKIKIQMDATLDEFQKSSQEILAKMQLASDNYKATVLTSSNKTSGFQNMDIKPNTSTKTSGFITVESAYNGQMNLEGFTTESDSAYLNNVDLFVLEKNVITTLKEFNKKYYGYQECLRKNQYASGSCTSTSGTDIGLNEVTSSNDAVITAVDVFKAAVIAMNASSKRISQVEFESRHDQIKETATRVSALRAELDIKMANLLDKTKGPLPEAQNKHNTENYVAIGWTVLATSLIYYVFVEMR